LRKSNDNNACLHRGLENTPVALVERFAKQDFGGMLVALSIALFFVF
jgi:hypothetical protein